jgi:hypothetical protein
MPLTNGSAGGLCSATTHPGVALRYNHPADSEPFRLRSGRDLLATRDCAVSDHAVLRLTASGGGSD